MYKLRNVYNYPLEHIAIEHQVAFRTITAEKASDIVVFQKDGKTAKIVLEVNRPDRKEGINQLKSYLNAEGSPVGVWSNGQERIILYRPYPRQFEDTLTEIPSFNQEPKDVLRAKLTLDNLYVVAFFNSRFGRFQVDRQVSGAIQGHLNLTIAEDILVPELSRTAQS